MHIQRIPDVAVAAAFLGLAVWVLALNWRNRLHRAFALFMLVLAVQFAGVGFDDTDAGIQLFVYALMASPFAAVDLALVFQRVYGRDNARKPSRAWQAARLALAVGWLGVAWLYTSNKELYNASDGPLKVFFNLPTAVYATLALLVALQCLRSPPGQRRDALLIFVTGFALQPAYFGVQRIGETIPVPDGAAFVAYANLVVVALTLALLVIMVVVVARVATRRSQDNLRRHARHLLLLLACAAATGAVIEWGLAGLPHGYFATAHAAANAAWELAFAAMVAYGILRYCLFSLDPRFARLVREGGTGALLASIFFLAEQTLQQFVAQSMPAASMGWVVVTFGSGAIVAVTLSPVHHACGRLAQRVACGARGSTAFLQRSIDIYRAAFMAATQDGVVTARERRALHRLADTLGLPSQEIQLAERVGALAAIGPTSLA